jgi:RND superfamily putative drug exporter
VNALGRLAVNRPKHVLAVWLSIVGVLGLIGLHLESHLHQKADLVIKGTEFARADQLARDRFGRSETVAILLKGPASAINRQGPSLEQMLQRDPRLTVLAPWDLKDSRSLRPKPGAAVMIVRAAGTFEQAAKVVVPHVRQVMDRSVRPPLEYHLTGNADVSEGLHDATIAAVKKAEFFAAPLLMLVLLLVFRSPVAASLPLVIGGCTIGASRGVLELINRSSHLDTIALNLNVMMGLALGVDYALLLVSRYREELREGRTPYDAAATAVSTAGHTIVFAGIAVMCAMTAALFVTPGALLTSAAIGIVVGVVVSVVAALTALPASLVLLGERVNRHTIGRARGPDSRFGLAALRALRRPVIACALVLGIIALLSAPALAIDMGPATPLVLPKSQKQRVDYVEFGKTLGPGWTSPYEVIVASHRGAITDHKTLSALAQFQHRMAARHDVDAVLGPAEIAQRTSTLDSVPGQLAQANGELKGAVSDQTRLKGGLNSAAGGVGQLTSGLSSAVAGARALEKGGAAATSGAQRIAAGIGQARAGAQRMQAGLAAASSGAKALQAGAGRAKRGVAQLQGGLKQSHDKLAAGSPQIEKLAKALDQGGHDLGKLREPAQTADAQLQSALQALDKMSLLGKRDPQYQALYDAVVTAKASISGRNPLNNQPVQDGYNGIDSALAEASRQSGVAAGGVQKLNDQLGKLVTGLGQLETGAAKIGAGTGRLQGGLATLRSGLGRLQGGGAQLVSGLSQLEDAGTQLAAGTAKLQSGAGRLDQGLSSGAGRTGALRSGLGQMERGVANGAARTKQLAGGFGRTKQLGAVARSGYFSLAAIDRSPPAVRRTASFALNVDQGGNAVRFVIMGQGKVERAGHPLRPVLEGAMAKLAKKTGDDVRLGGGATRLQDYETTTTGRVWVLAIVLALVSYVVLVPVLRSVLLPLLAVALTGLTVLAALGVLVVLFQGSHPVLGGAGFTDAIMVFGIVSIAFALSVDYEVFLLARMREGWQIYRNTEEAVAYGLRKTAGVVTGAAMSMTGVFVAFTLTDVVMLRQLGAGLTVAVLLDATLVRLVLLPAAIRLFGDRCWWLPKPIERMLNRPRPAVGGRAAAPAPSPVSAPALRPD